MNERRPLGAKYIAAEQAALKKSWEKAYKRLVGILDSGDRLWLVDACLDLLAANQSYGWLWGFNVPAEPPVSTADDPRRFELAKRALKVGEHLRVYAQVDAREPGADEALNGLIRDLILCHNPEHEARE
jgi:hypothetical protein